jgi:O-antigen/teichoic acid export membrane protein
MAGKNLSARALVYMAAQLSANVVGFVTTLVLARLFSKQEMGDYQQLMMVYALFSGILIAGLPSCLTYFYPIAEEDRKPSVVYIVMGLLFLSGVALGLVTCFAAPSIGGYFKDNPRLASLIQSFFLFYAFTLGGAYMRRFLVAVERYKFLMAWLPFDRLLMLLSFALPALMGYGLDTAVKVAVWMAGAKFAITTLYTMSVIPPSSFVMDKSLAGKMLMYSLPLGISQAVGQMSRSIDRLVIGRYMDIEFFATFTWAATALPFIAEIAESVTTVLIPELAKLHKAGADRQFIAVWQESIRKTAIITVGLFGFFEALSGPIIIAIYSEKYVDSIYYFRLYQIGLIFRVTIFGAVLQSIGRTRYILYGSAIALPLKVMINITLFKFFGPTGLVFGSLFLGLSVMYYLLHQVCKELHTSVRRVWPWSYHVRIFAASVIGGAVTLAVYLIPKAGIVSALSLFSAWAATKASIVAAAQVVIGLAIFLPVYALLLHLLGVLKDKDWELLRRMTYGRFVRS